MSRFFGDELGQREWWRSRSCVPLDAGEVQIWRASARVGRAEMQRFWAMLSPDERQRVERMRVGIARDELLVGRGLLRMLLSGLLAQDGRSLVFNEGKHGKPRIEGAEFSVSHSKGLILIALCREAEVGVDVEWVGEAIEALEIASQSFSPEEYGRVAAAAEGQARARVFYECWTRKEAVAKAHGAGLLLPLAAFTTPAGELNGACVELQASLRDETERFAGGRFFLHELDPGEDFKGALAMKERDLRLRQFEVSEPFSCDPE